MLAACYYGARDIKVEDVEIPEISDDEILVQAYTIGICPTDVRYYLGLREESTYDNDKFTIGKSTYGLSGHEVSGKVVKIGKNVKGIKIGDFVVHETFVYCGECEYCKNGKINLCTNKKDIARGYSQYFKLPYRFAHVLSKDIDVDDAAFAEPLSVAIHAVKRLEKETDKVAIIGAGPMGILLAFAAKIREIEPALIEINEKRRDFAKSLGFQQVYNPGEGSFKEKINELTGVGFNGVICSVGGRDAIGLGIDIARSGGTIIIFGGTYPKDYLQLDPNSIHYSEKIITGSSDHTTKDIEEALDIINKKEIPFKKLVTKTFSLNEIKEAFESAISGKEMKVQIKIKRLI